MHKLYAFLLLVFMLSLSAFSQEQKINREISGKVVMDPGDGKQESVEYANISLLSLPDSTFLAGATSDKEGKFSLRLHCDLSQKYLLKTSFTGCLPVWQEISGTAYAIQAGTIRLKEDVKTLNEVVVTALGIKRSEKALSYNVQQLSGDELTTVKDANFISSLNGKVAGVNINSSNTTGGASRVVMRGVKSITSSNLALYVIDGVPMYNMMNGGGGGIYDQQGTDGAADINPEDIESINMLTGPAAAALYGNAAASGVVLINTKKGTKDKTNISVSSSTTFSNPTMLPKMQNKYGNKDGVFASWGDVVNSNYDPEKFFRTGVNTINSVSLSTGTSKNQTYVFSFGN